ncbi:MAG: hypothetical protein V1797_02040 [Pseudomonadota bacterium]
MREPDNDNPALAERQDALTSLLVLLALVQAGDWRGALAALPSPAAAPAAPADPTGPPKPNPRQPKAPPQA